MKSIDIFCASPASTAICSSTDQRKMVRQGGIRPLHDHIIHRRLADDHRYHHYRDKAKTKTKTPVIPCSSEIPISPRLYFETYRKSTSSSSYSSTTTTPKLSLEFLRRKSSADVTDLYSTSRRDSSSSSKYLLSDTPLSLDLYSDEDPPPPPPRRHHHQQPSSKMVLRDPPRQQPLKNINASKRHNDDVKESSVFRSSNSLSNYPYDDIPVFEISSSSSSLSRRSVDLHAHQKHSSSLSRLNHHRHPPWNHHHHVHGQNSRVHDDFHVQKSALSRVSSSSHATKQSSSLTTCKDESSLSDKSSRSRDHQVVELRVSIHCKGCEGKIRKHLSRMEGVTSFSIDLATKKVTVIGNVTPLGVLTSISKVKFAEFWPSPTPSSSSNSSSATTSSTSTTTSDMSIISY